ncbi:hypothetical protein DQ384_39820 [Sphaerisporangium album]|uniref:Uncharacterized protein n=1 Tax=Sphaerisporangium album TaxID=509200 RepID=A0A367EIS8_9ACTN|nr:hypothetical protein [Sphaerisporangium album]RCG17277.1 hypothetical protein DQ384_39820 [Sphaerisporangium album]
MGPEFTFAVQTLYRRYGQHIYARAAADPAFSEVIAARAEASRNLLREHPLPGRPGTHLQRMALCGYLLGQTHALLQELLDAAMDEDGGSSAGTLDGDSASVRLGAMFQLAFDAGLLKLETSAHR